MDKLGAFESFVSAVQVGSLSGAARQRGLSQPAISQQISALETQFKTQLLHRGRGGVQMTQAGELVFQRALVILEEHANLVTELTTMNGQIAGRIVITANLGISQYVLGDVIVDLKQKHPELEVILRADARILDLNAEGIDLALRTGTPGSRNEVAHKIGKLSMVLVATPTYLDQAGRPKTPDDLDKLDYIQFKSGDDQVAIKLKQNGEIIQAPIKISFTAQYPDLITKALGGHLGFAQMPEFVVSQAIEDGQLEVLLPDLEVPDGDLFLVFSSTKKRPPSHAAVLKTLLEHLENSTGMIVLASADSLLR
jgi:DNA-binding transcriptional LysR family regulator